jgi:hypothetical protein
MSTWNWFRTSLSAAALVLCATAPAQWTSRLDYVHDDDQAAACCVDHSGNVYVVGKVYATAAYLYDLECVSYDSSGSERWRYHFNSTYCYDDIGTAIACDWQGNVYCAGVTKDSDGHGHFTVLKLTSSGATVWPTSGSGGSGSNAYIFDHGAIRLNDNSDDGSDADNKLVCAISMENVPGAQPTFAITGPSKAHNLAANRWRTVVFEDDGSGGVRIKSGWPVDDYGYSSEDSSYAVAIYPEDHTVYVTGSAHPSAMVGNQDYATVRYHADGSAVYWRDTWEDGLKGNVGKAIALDADGDAYVTGILGGTDETNADTKYGTARLHKNSASPQNVWRDEYDHSGYPDEATSISLSTEIESGALKTYAYVTGLSGNSSTGFLEIATIRYRGASLNREWVDRRGVASHDCKGLSVLAAGRGNVYVAGIENNDYKFFALNKTPSTRFTPITYDNDMGFDEARFVVSGGAGLAYYTGASHNGTDDLDFLTRSHPESVSSFTPTAYSSDGSNITGDSGSSSAQILSDLGSSDNSRVTADLAVLTSTDSHVAFELDGVVTTTNASEMSVTVESHVTAAHVWQKVEVYCDHTSSWVTVSDQLAPNGSDGNTVIVLKEDPAYFMPAAGTVKVRVTYYGNSTTGWTQASDGNWKPYIDLVQWNAIGA